MGARDGREYNISRCTKWCNHCLSLSLPLLLHRIKTHRRRLVQEQNGRILDDGPRYRQPLLLPATHVDAPFSQVRLISIAELHDEIVCMCGLGCRNNLIACRTFQAVGNVLGDGALEKDGLEIRGKGKKSDSCSLFKSHKETTRIPLVQHRRCAGAGS